MIKTATIIFSLLLAALVQVGVCPLCLIDCCSCNEETVIPETSESCCHAMPVSSEEEASKGQDEECNEGCLKSVDTSTTFVEFYKLVDLSPKPLILALHTSLLSEKAEFTSRVNEAPDPPPQLHCSISSTVLLI